MATSFDGKINFENGNVVAYTKNPLSSGTDSVIIMLQLNKGLINPTRVVNESFESVKAQAFKGSDYDYDTGTGENSSELPQEAPSFFELVLGMVIAVFPFAIIIYFLRRKRRPKKKIRTLYKNADYFREAPIEKNLEATFVLASGSDQILQEHELESYCRKRYLAGLPYLCHTLRHCR